MEKNKRNGIKHLMALMLFFMVLSAGMVSLADVKGTVIAKRAVIRASADQREACKRAIGKGDRYHQQDIGDRQQYLVSGLCEFRHEGLYQK